MMSFFKLSLFCCFFSLTGLAQDTLFFKDKQKLVVHVKEISQAEIQYKKIDLPDGPMYIVSKNDIEKIIFKNGYAEVFKPEPVQAVEQTLTVYNNVVNINTEKIVYNDTKKRYYTLVNLIDRHPDPSRKNKLMSSAAELRGLKRHQDGTRTGAIIFGGVAVAGGLLCGLYLTSESYLDPILAAPPIAFGILGIGLGTVSIAINSNLRKKRHEFVNLYNQ
jgi:hypothetical protein